MKQLLVLVLLLSALLVGCIGGQQAPAATPQPTVAPAPTPVFDDAAQAEAESISGAAVAAGDVFSEEDLGVLDIPAEDLEV